MSPAQIEAALRPSDDFHQPITGAVSFEDTHNRHGGVVWPLADLRAAPQTARSNGLRVQLDGARSFNAAGAGGKGLADVAAARETRRVCSPKAGAGRRGALSAQPSPLRSPPTYVPAGR